MPAEAYREASLCIIDTGHQEWLEAVEGGAVSPEGRTGEVQGRARGSGGQDLMGITCWS